MLMDERDWKKWLGDTAKLVMSFRRDNEQADIYTWPATDGVVRFWTVHIDVVTGDRKFNDEPNWEGSVEASADVLARFVMEFKCEGWRLVDPPSLVEPSAVAS